MIVRSTSLNRMAAALALGAAMFGLSAQAATSDFMASYKGGTTSCGTTYKIKGMEPADAGKRPVFIYTVGTTETYDNATAMAAVKGMADRGYVAATIEYASGVFGRCSAITQKAKCIFDKSSAQSAIAAVCARAKADCSKGVVTGGFSQGSIIAILAKNYDTRVQAAYGMGAHRDYAGVYDTSICIGDGKRALPSTRLRVINGEADVFVGSSLANVRKSSQVLTGYNCTGTTCLQTNGNGWRIVMNADVRDGSADHCYMRDGGCLATQANLDPGWASGSADWELAANLDWLTKYTTK
jgi:hypothetical protein